MPVYAYKAKSPQGNVVKDKVEADDLRGVATKLRAQSLTLISAEEDKGGGGGFKLFGGGPPKISIAELALFSRQFSTMINAGLPILQGLSTVTEQTPNPKFKEVLKKIKDKISQGSAFSDCLGEYPTVFPPLFTNMVRAGEAGGMLDGVLSRLSTYFEAADKLRRKVKGAMMYPMVMASVAATVTIFLLVGVLPTFKSVFESFGKELPLPTKVMMDISDFLVRNVLFVIATPFALFFGLKFAMKYKSVQNFWGRNQLKLPLFGSLLRKVAVARFAQTLGTLLKSGVPVLQALEICGKVAGSVVVEDAIFRIRDSVKNGENLSVQMKASGFFPTMLLQMVVVGEETGQVDEMMVRASAFYEEEVTQAVEGLTALMEPIVIVGMGISIGAIVVAMFLPMFSMGEMAG